MRRFFAIDCIGPADLHMSRRRKHATKDALCGHRADARAVLVSSPALAQITTGTVSGNVKDSSGWVIPGATVVLISETRGTKSAPAVTNEAGNYVFPNVTPDTYTVEVTLEAFKTVRQTGIAVSGGDRIGIQPLTLDAGALAETRDRRRGIPACPDAER